MHGFSECGAFRGVMMKFGSESEKASPQAASTETETSASASREAELAQRMAKLSQRLDTEAKRAPKASDSSGMGQGYKAAADLSGGVIVGVILGLGLDRIAGSSPWGLIIFLMLGFCAGVVNMLRGFGMALPWEGNRPPRRE